MFVGHYAVSFWAKRRDRSIPLWVLFIAVQFVDVLWGIFVLTGVEHFRLVPRITEASPLDLYDMPYTHSLIAVLGWSLVVYGLYRRLGPGDRNSWRPAALVAFAVFSHWLLDLLVHRPDLPLWDDTIKVGLGLWYHAKVTFIVEVGALGVTMYLWYRAIRGSVPGWRLLVLFGILAASQAYSNFGPVAKSTTQFAAMCLGFYFGFALLSHWCDAPRVRATS